MQAKVSTGSVSSVPDTKQPYPIIGLDIVSGAIAVLCAILSPTWRYKQTGPGWEILNLPSQPALAAFWHEHLLNGFHAFRHLHPKALISSSRDGTRLSAVLQRWGYTVIRGSSSRRGYTSMRECIRALRAKSQLVMTPDGPRGPRRVMKPGIAQIASSSDAPVVPVSIRVFPCTRLRSWDRFVVPWPFATVSIHAHDALRAEQFSGESDPHKAFLLAIERGLNS